MADTPPPAARQVRQRSRRPVGWVLLVGLLLLIGRGMGWAGNEASPTGGARLPGDLAANVVAATAAVAPAAVARIHDPAASQPEPPPAAPAGETAGAAGQLAAAGESPAFDADRFASMASALTTHTTQGELGAALATLQHMQSLPLDGAQRAALLAAAAPLEGALAAGCARIVQCLCQGRVLAARDELSRLFADGAPFAEPWLDSALRTIGLPGGLLRASVPGELPLPVARPLPRGREVRVQAPGRQGQGAVVDSRSDQVTVRLPTANGWSFPTVAALACEPVQPTADEAIEMGLLAVQARADLLARLWLAVARHRSPQGLSPRGERLALALP